MKMVYCPLDATGGDKEQCRVEKYCNPGVVEFIHERDVAKRQTEENRKLYAAAIWGEKRPSILKNITFFHDKKNWHVKHDRRATGKYFRNFTHFEFINDNITRINSKELTKAPCSYF